MPFPAPQPPKAAATITGPLKRLLQAGLGRFGYRLVRLDGAPLPNALPHFFSMIKKLGFAPRHVIDVGANKGNWTREAIKFFPSASYILIEPQDCLKVHVRDLIACGKVRWINAGASDRSGRSLFYISDNDESGSFLPPEPPARVAVGQPVLVELRTLNEIVASGDAPLPDMVKIDAEGLDLRVLSGASHLVGKTDIFFLEAAVVCRAGFQNTLLEVVRRMADSGYTLIDFTHLNRSPKYGVLWLCEAVFLRNGSPLLDGVASYQ